MNNDADQKVDIIIILVFFSNSALVSLRFAIHHRSVLRNSNIFLLNKDRVL